MSYKSSVISHTDSTHIMHAVKCNYISTKASVGVRSTSEKSEKDSSLISALDPKLIEDDNVIDLRKMQVTSPIS